MSCPRTPSTRRRPQQIAAGPADHARPAAAAARDSSPAAVKKTRRPPPVTSSRAPPSSSTRRPPRAAAMGQPPQPQPDAQSLLDFIQAMEPVKPGVEPLPQWMNVTIIEDDDLTFGGKPLSTWYEEDRRRYSLGEDSVPPLAFDLAQDEEPRGRQRVCLPLPCVYFPAEDGGLTGRLQDRPHYHRPSHKHHHHQHKKSSKAEEKKH